MLSRGIADIRRPLIRGAPIYEYTPRACHAEQGAGRTSASTPPNPDCPFTAWDQPGRCDYITSVSAIVTCRSSGLRVDLTGSRRRREGPPPSAFLPLQRKMPALGPKTAQLIVFRPRAICVKATSCVKSDIVLYVSIGRIQSAGGWRGESQKGEKGVPEVAWPQPARRVGETANIFYLNRS